mmetsp:Transcript_10388/g.11922  ORF Transcript_10388/g.11922 Transcript_10388/m.11922 type:complete len:97 (-) Transcript_10388:17-307(-)
MIDTVRDTLVHRRSSAWRRRAHRRHSLFKERRQLRKLGLPAARLGDTVRRYYIGQGAEVVGGDIHGSASLLESKRSPAVGRCVGGQGGVIELLLIR